MSFGVYGGCPSVVRAGGVRAKHGFMCIWWMCPLSCGLAYF